MSRGGRRGRPARGGFTLIEMMVVIAILGTLAMLVGPSVFRNVEDANLAAARSQIEIFAVALESYRVDQHRYPTTEEGLAALRRPPGGLLDVAAWRGPYLRRSVPEDPWGRPYEYRSPGIRNPESYDLFSLGRDGAEGGDGEDQDLTSWGEGLRP